MSPTHKGIMVELHHLRAVQAVARTGSLTAAARDLHCTQSALSHLLSELERAVGVRLVDRERRPVVLTAAGERVSACAAAVLPQVAALDEDLARLRNGTTGRLLISLECHSCIEWLAPAMAAYRAAHPHIDLDLRMGANFDPLPSLAAGAVDLVITGERSGAAGIASDPLFRYQIIAAVPERSAVAGKSHLEPGDFAGATVITYPVSECRLDLYTRFLEPAGVVPARRRTAELTAMIIQWVASGQGLAALPSWALPNDPDQIALRPLGRSGLWADLHALRRARDAGAAHLDAFVAVVRRESFRALPGILPVPGRPRGSGARAAPAERRRRSRT
jgi:LysR family transcriptional regulator for metE and metH